MTFKFGIGRLALESIKRLVTGLQLEVENTVSFSFFKRELELIEFWLGLARDGVIDLERLG